LQFAQRPRSANHDRRGTFWYQRIHDLHEGQREGRDPRRLDDLVSAGILPALPLDPDQKPYVFDRKTGAVTSSAGRVLGGS